MDYKDKIVFSFPGGGLRATEAQAGMVKAFNEFGIKADNCFGTSGGAITTLLYCAGVEDMLSFFKRVDMDKAIVPYYYVGVLFGKPAYDNDGFLEFLKQEFKDSNFSNGLVTLTEESTGFTYYAVVDAETTVGSTSIPECFRKRILVGKEMYRIYTPEPKKSISITTERTRCIKKKITSLDGGIYNMIPMPEGELIDGLKHLFIFLPNNDVITEAVHQQNRVGRILGWVGETMEREARTIYRVYGKHPKVTILKPQDFRSSLLSFSENYGLYEHAYQYAKEVLMDHQTNKKGFFNGQGEGQ